MLRVAEGAIGEGDVFSKFSANKERSASAPVSRSVETVFKPFWFKLKGGKKGDGGGGGGSARKTSKQIGVTQQ